MPTNRLGQYRRLSRDFVNASLYAIRSKLAPFPAANLPPVGPIEGPAAAGPSFEILPGSEDRLLPLIPSATEPGAPISAIRISAGPGSRKLIELRHRQMCQTRSSVGIQSMLRSYDIRAIRIHRRLERKVSKKRPLLDFAIGGAGNGRRGLLRNAWDWTSRSFAKPWHKQRRATGQSERTGAGRKQQRRPD